MAQVIYYFFSLLYNDISLFSFLVISFLHLISIILVVFSFSFYYAYEVMFLFLFASLVFDGFFGYHMGGIEIGRDLVLLSFAGYL